MGHRRWGMSVPLSRRGPTVRYPQHGAAQTPARPAPSTDTEPPLPTKQSGATSWHCFARDPSSAAGRCYRGRYFRRQLQWLQRAGLMMNLPHQAADGRSSSAPPVDEAQPARGAAVRQRTPSLSVFFIVHLNSRAHGSVRVVISVVWYSGIAALKVIDTVIPQDSRTTRTVFIIHSFDYVRRIRE